jgi:hypothetical protein
MVMSTRLSAINNVPRECTVRIIAAAKKAIGKHGEGKLRSADGIDYDLSEEELTELTEIRELMDRLFAPNQTNETGRIEEMFEKVIMRKGWNGKLDTYPVSLLSIHHEFGVKRHFASWKTDILKRFDVVEYAIGMQTLAEGEKYFRSEKVPFVTMKKGREIIKGLLI